jgi:predicted dehydrogenase
VADHQLHWAYRTRGLERTNLDLPPATFTVREVLTSFEALLRQGVPPPVGLEDGARAVQLAEACATAAALGRAVDVPDLPTT